MHLKKKEIYFVVNYKSGTFRFEKKFFGLNITTCFAIWVYNFCILMIIVVGGHNGVKKVQ